MRILFISFIVFTLFVNTITSAQDTTLVGPPSSNLVPPNSFPLDVSNLNWKQLGSVILGSSILVALIGKALEKLLDLLLDRIKSSNALSAKRKEIIIGKQISVHEQIFQKLIDLSPDLSQTWIPTLRTNIAALETEIRKSNLYINSDVQKLCYDALDYYKKVEGQNVVWSPEKDKEFVKKYRKLILK